MGRDSRGRAQEAQWKLMLQGSQVCRSPASHDCGLGAMHVSLCSIPLSIVPIGVHAELECLNGMSAAGKLRWDFSGSDGQLQWVHAYL